MKIIVASGPVIIEENNVLLNKHGEDSFWKFPGGQVEQFDFDDETNSLEEACKREVLEEMGIKVEISRPLKPMMFNAGDKWVVLIHYLAKRIGEVHPGEDVKEWAWHDLENLPNDLAKNIKPVLESI